MSSFEADSAESVFLYCSIIVTGNRDGIPMPNPCNIHNTCVMDFPLSGKKRPPVPQHRRPRQIVVSYAIASMALQTAK